jgi:hypothetical protein
LTIVTRIVVLEERIEKPTATAAAPGIATTATVAMLGINVIGSHGIRHLADDSRPRNGPEQTDGDPSDIRNHLHLPLGFLLLPLLCETFSGTGKRFATLGAVRVSIRRNRAAEYALCNEPRGAAGTLLCATFVEKSAIGAGDTLPRCIGRISGSAKATNNDASLSGRTAMIASGERHGSAAYHAHHSHFYCATGRPSSM